MLQVLHGLGHDHGEGDEEDAGFRVGEHAQARVLLLAKDSGQWPVVAAVSMGLLVQI